MDNVLALTSPITDNQRAYLKALFFKKFDTETAHAHCDWLVDHVISRQLASEKISALKVLPDVETTEEEALTVGMYDVDGRVYKVQQSRESGRLYAKELVDGKFIYASGAIYRITAGDRMSLEDAKAYGKLTGTCCSCGRELTNEDSIEAGIGPICAGKF